jgi:biopolymer transport protein ExbB
MGAFSDLGTAAPVLALLALMSIVSIAIIFSRLISLRGVASGQNARQTWLDGLEVGTVTEPPGKTTPADRVGARAFTLMSRDVTQSSLSADLEQMGNAEVISMNRGIRLLELIGMIAPLLGLLGTVLGMIASFRALETAQGAANASILAGGIWQALLTTAAGLIVAIPAVVGATLLQSRAEVGIQEMERVITRATLAQSLRQKDAA